VAMRDGGVVFAGDVEEATAAGVLRSRAVEQ
jgi:hypothetical protein